ncbi:MAG: methyl-accepting chemotaxis protein [Cellvibrionaceae bacterium]
MKNLSIRQKILFSSVAPVIVLALVLMWIVYNSSRSVAEETSGMISFSMLESTKATVKNNVDMAVSAIKPIYDKADADDEEAKKQVLSILRSMDFDNGNYIFVYQYDGVNLATRPKPSLEGRNLIDLKDANGKLLIKDLIDIAKKGGDFYQYIWFNPANDQDEPKMSYSVGLEKWGWMIGTGVYMNYINEEVGFIRDQIHEEANSAVIFELIVTLVVVGLTIFVGSVFAGYIANPVQEMTEIMDEVSEGDLSVRMNSNTGDEIGQFADKFNVFLEKIHGIMTNISSSANQLAESSSDLNLISKETYDAISQQDSETISIASAVEVMSGSAREIAANGDTVKEAANDAGSKTSEGSAAVKDNLDSVKLLANDISQAAEAVSAVEKRTDEIQSMLEVIHSVTEQTNLLALNAAIEAARAGEQGRGFAVVADEVRSLAMRSAESAEEIRKIIEGLISDTQSAVSTMNLSSERSQENLERTNLVANSLNSIDEAIQSILEKSAYIANATEEQNNTAQEIADNTGRIKNISTTSADRMKQTRDSSQKLDALSKDMLNSINFFKFH